MHRKRKKYVLILYVPFWLLIIGMFLGLLLMQATRYEEYRAELDRLNVELVREQQVGDNLRYRQAFYESDAYIEQLAREMLGFIREDEILFTNIAEN
ncbi:MAG: septum formation initiator family protein [Turicibacter sp.]|nr:septum formation initiator family protein [Turicibacter sp.]